MQCAVWNCVNERKDNEARKSFFVFPKDHDLREKWLDFCGRPSGFKPNTWRVCMDHFRKEDILGDLAFVMGLRGKRSLKCGAVPCIYTNVSFISEVERMKLQKKQKRRNKTAQKNDLTTPTTLNTGLTTIDENSTTPTTISTDLTMIEDNSTKPITLSTGLIIRKLSPNAEIPGSTGTTVTINNVTSKITAPIKTDVSFALDDEEGKTVASAEIQALKNQIQKLKQENFVLQQEKRRAELNHQQEKYILQRKIEKVELENKNLQELLLGTFPAEFIHINATASKKLKSMQRIIHEEQVKKEIFDENLEENIENIKQEKIAEEPNQQLLDRLTAEEIKMEFIDEHLEADLMQQKLAEQNIREHLEVPFTEGKFGVCQETISETPIEIKAEPEW